MQLTLNRKRFNENNTVGELFVDGVFECYTLEDTVREVKGKAVSSWKIKGKTAIPYGQYEVVRTMSPKFGKILPLLLSVPGFAGIRIHPGNTEKDTEGCLLVGQTRTETAVLRSVLAFKRFDQKLKAAMVLGEKVWITIGG